ncbi:ribosomal protein L6 [Linderina pennispora]|uniref:Ribosomal protein L6 n=1 Tax=Linderina pennispora TaxID=61395 RepID=A0A1Y1VY26_9FUNG|nr:ribosomal protein L6 [Linderina pennispora]ORX65714.1 ribosomal protein L6 [Linderina pennispora]
MKHIFKDDVINVPEGVTVEVKARQVRVTGPRGTLQRDLRHINMDVQRPTRDTIRVIGFEYKMRFVYAHFPISVNIEKKENLIEIRNFLGEKHVRKVPMLEGVEVVQSINVKDEIVLTGNDIDNVSQSAASIQQATRVRNKDIRKFLDGANIVKEE